MSQTKSKLPAPRMQLRWESAGGENWLCHYELVIALKKHDVRREIWKDGRELKRKLPKWVAIPMKPPTKRNSSSRFPPCTSGDGKRRYADDPWRDGVHARLDAAQLGGIPVYVIAPDGMAFLMEDLGPEPTQPAPGGSRKQKAEKP